MSGKSPVYTIENLKHCVKIVSHIIDNSLAFVYTHENLLRCLFILNSRAEQLPVVEHIYECV